MASPSPRRGGSTTSPARVWRNRPRGCCAGIIPRRRDDALQCRRTPAYCPTLSSPCAITWATRSTTRQPAPAWTPRQVVDDGKKLYLLYPEVTLFTTVPLVRLIGVNGPQLVNARQYLNVVILDQLAPTLELRVGVGEAAEVVTITRGKGLRTITCPDDGEDCPQWPSAARQLARRTP